MLIKQHEHGLISGIFAANWAGQPRPLAPTLHAISEHDVGWQKLDATVLWDEESGKPHSFTSYPTVPKLRAYKEGLDFLEAQSPYAASLCSMHYSSLVGDSRAEEEFRRGEDERRRRLRGALAEEESESLERNLRFLQLCDDLSLFVCLNEPGRNDHPWYEHGIRFEGTTFEPVWEDRSTLRFDPNPFSGPFEIVVPYAVVDKGGRPAGSGRHELRVTC